MQQSLGLGDVSILLPNADAFGSAIERISSRGNEALLVSEFAASFEDPWGNQVSLAMVD